MELGCEVLIHSQIALSFPPHICSEFPSENLIHVFQNQICFNNDPYNYKKNLYSNFLKTSPSGINILRMIWYQDWNKGILLEIFWPKLLFWLLSVQVRIYCAQSLHIIFNYPQKVSYFFSFRKTNQNQSRDDKFCTIGFFRTIQYSQLLKL